MDPGVENSLSIEAVQKERRNLGQEIYWLDASEPHLNSTPETVAENPFRQLLAKYPDLTRPNFNASIPPHDVVHHIRTTGPPVFSRLCRLAPARLAAVKAEFEHMLQMGIIRQSESPWASPLHMIPKVATGEWRPCGDNTALNNITVPDSYPLPHLQCVFGVFPIEFLGHLVDFRGIHPPRSKVTSIRDFPPPSFKRQLQRILGMVTFYRRFIPHCAGTMLPPTSLLLVSKGSFELSADPLTAFDKVKAALADATLLTHFSPEAPISSNVAVGAVLQQHLAGCTRIHTTAYHPAANGIVERFHRQLKASIRAADDPENWTDYLPIFLLDIRSFLKSDLDCFAAELVCGATVQHRGQAISPTPPVALEDPTNLLHRLRQFMRTISLVAPRSSNFESYLEKDLATCSYFYLRCDRVRRPLEPPYDGPFRVISRGTKNFRIHR
nr:unnamed protein product [Spirometra erinaceieuropaei]